jgi:glycerol uptake facilitator-like aquaporin
MKAYLFEFVATLIFVYVIIATGNCFAIGATLSLLCMIGAKISGCSVNPAVTLALLTSGKLAASHVIPYIGAEVAGALTAVQLHKLLKKYHN